VSDASEELRSRQAPLKERYREDAAAAVIVLKAAASLEALAACAGVTLRAVATALEIPVRGGRIEAEGDLDFRGTLGVSKDAPVGFMTIRLRFLLDTDASPEQQATLLKLTERYCVVLRTLRTSPVVTATLLAA